MINWFDMPAEGLSNGGMFEIKELTATENKVYQKDGEVYNKVTVNVEGGGGSSDFSTAELTVSVNTGGFDISNAVEIFDDEMSVVDSFETGTYVLVLYKGLLIGGITPLEGYTISSASGTGGVTVTTNQFGRQVEITGDGTLTVELTTT